MIQINDRKKYELHLAPLQGYADWIYRNTFELCFGGIDVYYTPFIRVEKDRSFRNKDLRDIDPLNNTVPCLIPQILPGTPEELRLLAGLVAEKNYKKIDINLGCPYPMIIGKKKGSGMLPFPEIVTEVLNTIKEFPVLSFSVKLRLGWENPDECLRLLPLLNGLPLSHVTLHARLGKQQYKGETDKEAFRQFYESCEHPLFYNGDLCSKEDIKYILERFDKLAGISVGRGLLGNPFLAVDSEMQGKLPEREIMKRLRDFHSILYSSYENYLQGDVQLLMKMKSLWDYFLPQVDKKLLKKIRKANKISQYNEAVKAIFD